MAETSTGKHRMFDPEPEIAALNERVVSLGSQIRAVEHTQREGFSAINSRLDVLARDMTAGQKTPWPVIWSAMGVCAAILGIIGGIIYTPIRAEQADLKGSFAEQRKDTADALASIVQNTVSRQEMDWRSTRGAEDRDRLDKSVGALREQMVPRPEYDERWRGADQRFADIQRQIDALDSRYSDTFSLKDSYAEMRAELRSQREEIARLTAERTRGTQP